MIKYDTSMVSYFLHLEVLFLFFRWLGTTNPVPNFLELGL